LHVATIADFDRLFQINAKGVFLCYKYAAEQMLRQGRGGRLIAASSLAGIVAEDGMFAYGASKFAVRGLTQSAAKELGKHGITANTYSPGAILTEMRKHTLYLACVTVCSHVSTVKEATPRRPDGSYDFGIKEQISPLKRLGLPEDLASMVSYLASPESKFITAQTLSVDGGASSAA
jgi:NAD(P)-dependent dehydrogenase (short-subunit alcohol dehydrogenase family)